MHGGGLPGFTTVALRIPSERVFAAVLSNNPDYPSSPEYLARSLAADAMGDPYPEREATPIPLAKLMRGLRVSP